MAAVVANTTDWKDDKEDHNILEVARNNTSNTNNDNTVQHESSSLGTNQASTCRNQDSHKSQHDDNQTSHDTGSTSFKATNGKQDSETDFAQVGSSAAGNNSKMRKLFNVKKNSNFRPKKMRMPLKPIKKNNSNSSASIETASIDENDIESTNEPSNATSNRKFRIPFPKRGLKERSETQDISDVSSEDETPVLTLEERLGEEALEQLRQIAQEFVRDEKGQFMFYIDPARYVGNPKSPGPLNRYSLPPHFSGTLGAGTFGLEFDAGPPIPGYGGQYGPGGTVVPSVPGVPPGPPKPSTGGPTPGTAKPKTGGGVGSKPLLSGSSNKPAARPPTEGLPQQIDKAGPKSAAPPPGGVGGGFKGKTKENVKVGKKDKKALHWNKVPVGQLNGTVWADLNDENIDLDVDELDDLFGVDPSSTGGGGIGSSAQEEQPQQLEILPHKRKHNINVLLATLKMSSDDIKDVVRQLKYKELDEDKLQALVVVSPTEEEETVLREMFGEKEKANQTDSFMMELAQLPGLRGKLQCALSAKTFDEVARDVISDMKTFTKIPEEIMKSSKLLKILELVLRVGNMLNGGTNRGGAHGFKLDTLPGLRTFKSAKGITLVQYIVRLLERKYPGILPVEDELSHLASSAQISLEGIGEDVAQVLDSITTVTEQVQKIGDDPLLAAFKAEMDAFANRSFHIRDQIVELRATLVEKLQTMMEWFGESRNKANRGRQEEVLKLLRTFVEDLNTAKKQNELQDKKEAEKAMKAAKTGASKS
ncbi:hypothetical protein GpartN1_g831.t1 [Galdieria partita]|uniref:FH2 domain-containing protein n=1 Tax=Galdieria partita TaxID=83374 RepID=A0A9C7UMR3_9RHOD|nr:hypothetical protein GpartN1_g831.t1 [Galdieria partita]